MASLAELAVQGIVTACGGGALLATVNAYFSRRATRTNIAQTQAATGKTRAEITSVGAGVVDVQVNTSLDILREMRIDLTAAREDIKAAREDIRAGADQIVELQQWKARHERRLDAHVRWDEQVRSVLAERGVAIDAPPPLRDDP